MLFAGLIYYIPSIICGVHAVRSGQQLYWVWILAIGGPIGAAVYFFAIMMPDLAGGRTARRVGQVARQALDPERDYRLARAALDDTPTVGNRMKVAQAAAALGRWDDAETQWAQCVTAHWAEDPIILMGHANALLELGRFQEALARLEQVKALGREGETPQVALAFARALEGLGRFDEADAPYRYAADRVPGLEAGGRYVAFLAKAGRKDDARIGLEELDRRLGKIAPPLRPEARRWRDLAARTMEQHVQA
jgi:hypothetical protein